MPPRRRSPFRSLALAAVVAAPLVVATSAGAEEAGLDTVVGELVQAWPEERHHERGSAPEADREPLSWVQPARGDSVRVPTGELPDVDGLAPGATVEVVVAEEVADQGTREGLDPARDLVEVDVLEAAPSVAEAVPGTTNEVTVVMVRPGGIPVPEDAPLLQDVVAQVDGPVAAFWSHQSGGRIQLDVTGQHDWITTATTCADDPFALWAEVGAAVGWTGGPGEHLLLYIPPTTPDCAYGLAEVGTGVGAGGYLYVTDVLTSLIAHELGHNFSLGHASLLQCDGTVDEGSVDDGSCRVLDYEDLYDVMGGSWEEMGTLGAPHAARLGLLEDRVRTLDPGYGGDFSLDAVGAPSGLKAVRLLAPNGDEYWLELRAATGQDSWLGTAANWPGLESGVVLRLATEGDDTSLLLDATPSPASGWDTDFDVALDWDSRVTVADRRFGLGDILVGRRYDGSWYGSGRVESAIRVRYRASGGSAGELGTDVSEGPDGCRTDGTCINQYAGGYIAYSPATGAQIVLNHVYDAWSVTGANNGAMGFPVAEWVCITGGCFQDFQNGTVASGGDGNAYVVRGPIEARWRALRALNGVLAEPLQHERCGLRGGGCGQLFEGGSVYWHPATGARATWGGIRARWAGYRAENGHLGYPTTDHRCGLRNGGCSEQFQGGAVYWSPATGAHATWGHVLTRWAATGREAGGHGYPTGEPRCGLRDGGCSQPFQRGAVYWSAGSGARSVGLLAPAITRSWAAQGAERGSLGYPVAEEQKVRDGYAQRFQGGTLTWNARTGQVRRS